MSLLMLHGKTVVGGGGGGLTITQPVAMWARTSGGAAATSASFSANSGEILVIGVGRDGGGAPVSPTTSPSLTVTSRAQDTAHAGTQIYTAPVTSTTSYTITLPASAEKHAGFVWVVAGQHASPIGVASNGNSTTNNINPAYTASAAGSVIFVASSEWQELGTPTSSNLTNTVHGNHAGWTENFVGRKLNVSAGATTFNLDAAGSGTANWSYVYLEILKA
jgi:hypothetical protein